LGGIRVRVRLEKGSLEGVGDMSCTCCVGLGEEGGGSWGLRLDISVGADRSLKIR